MILQNYESFGFIQHIVNSIRIKGFHSRFYKIICFLYNTHKKKQKISFFKNQEFTLKNQELYPVKIITIFIT